MKRVFAVVLTVLFATPAFAQNQKGLDRIKESEIKADLFALAGDEMRGREAGTLDELRASAWIAESARAAGLEPAGQDGTYFQWWNMRRVRQSTGSSVMIDGRPLALWKDVAVNGRFEAKVDAAVVWLTSLDSVALSTMDLRGKVAVVKMQAPPNAPGRNISLAARRYATAALNYATNRIRTLRERGPAALVVVADSMGDAGF